MAVYEMALQPLQDECEAWVPDDSDLVAEDMRFELGWNSTSNTIYIFFRYK